MVFKDEDQNIVIYL